MAYIPPHKRHSTGDDKPTPLPDSLGHHFKQSLSVRSDSAAPHRRRDKAVAARQGGNKIIYAAHSVSRWWLAGGGCGVGESIPASAGLQPFPCEPVERKSGGKPLVLAAAGDPPAGAAKDCPWVSIAQRIEPDLLASTAVARAEVVSETEEVKLSFVARVGKVFFHGEPSVCLDSIRKAVAAEADSRKQVHKSFYTNVPNEYMEDIQQYVVPKLGFDFESEKEHYHVKVFDKCRTDSTISCKCTVKDGLLEIHKIELNQVRHLVADISCLCKDLDLRLMLVTKRILKALNDEEKDGIDKLIMSAVIDPDVKGGLRWPLGKESVAERFSIVGIWHTKYKSFKSQRVRLKLRHADRFDHRTSTGEVANEVTLKLTGISKQLRDGDLESSSLMDMVQETVQLIWDHLLSFSHSG